jgi:hypothetical protein
MAAGALCHFLIWAGSGIEDAITSKALVEMERQALLVRLDSFLLQTVYGERSKNLWFDNPVVVQADFSKSVEFIKDVLKYVGPLMHDLVACGGKDGMLFERHHVAFVALLDGQVARRAADDLLFAPLFFRRHF